MLAIGLGVFVLANLVQAPPSAPSQERHLITPVPLATSVPGNERPAEVLAEIEGLVEPVATEEEADHQAAAGPELETVEATPTAPVAPSPTVVEEETPAVKEAPSAVRRVGIQAGHWRSAELPAELAGLRTSTGTAGGGVAEWQLNLDIARRVTRLLEAEGVAADLLPATVPPGYRADAFVALHADGNTSGSLSGFKLAGARWSTNQAADNDLMAHVAKAYGAVTGLKTDSHVSRNMTGYYAFNYRRFQHAVAQSTPAVILEMGFMTNASDLRLLLGAKDRIAQGIAEGVLSYLEARQ